MLRADLGTVAARVRAEGIRPPAIIVIGPTAAFALADIGALTGSAGQ
ncbi:Possible multifunctional enzyme siroheme synthase CysG/Uroporphyrin-III C-methyltransferase-like [Mycobacteroides abscessus subsp. abscessus]|nr:Possible multifunctional enzyme siroheme synthase CysG/Uroporphyrin-III C-methyltransferase-like [Mycobacteroides abscessus subsp. abscessus]